MEKKNLPDEIEELIEQKVEERVKEELAGRSPQKTSEKKLGDVSRRSFLKKLGAGALGLGALSLSPAASRVRVSDQTIQKDGTNIWQGGLFNTNDYLPKAGGTVSGSLLVEGGWENHLNNNFVAEWFDVSSEPYKGLNASTSARNFRLGSAEDSGASNQHQMVFSHNNINSETTFGITRSGDSGSSWSPLFEVQGNGQVNIGSGNLNFDTSSSTARELNFSGSDETIAWRRHVNNSEAFVVKDVTNNSKLFYVKDGGGVSVPNGNLNVQGNTVWHTGNDGSGSGLDADTVDGQHAGDLSPSSTSGVDGYAGRAKGGFSEAWRDGDNGTSVSLRNETITLPSGGGFSSDYGGKKPLYLYFDGSTPNSNHYMDVTINYVDGTSKKIVDSGTNSIEVTAQTYLKEIDSISVSHNSSYNGSGNVYEIYPIFLPDHTHQI